ncbi:hypothetical protein RUM43_007554 [Polyplax serrata]|uniref:Dynein regulatory complex subunit 4 n=1 Tax=Polyplax serrata TaxID=468196 RepID=A0AAN8PMV8_POLSC
MGPKKKKAPVIVDGIDTTSLTREQLETFALNLKETLDKEREERSLFQMERDKIRTYWDITRQQLEECKTELLNKEREIEEKENEHYEESKLFKQRIKYLVYEHHKNEAELRADGMLSLKISQEDFDQQETALLIDKKNLKEKLVEQQKEHQETIRNLNMKFSEELSEARSNFEMRAREIEAKYEDDVQTLREELALRHRMELTEVDERKNKQISDLMLKHDKAFSEMKNYYNDLILNNLTLISNLKDQMEEMKSREDRVEKMLKECQKENKNLADPMKQALAENRDLKRQLVNYTKDKIALAQSVRRVVDLERELDDYKWENEALELRLTKLEEQRNELQDGFFSSMMNMQEKAATKNVLLQKKMRNMLKLMEQREMQYAEFLKSHKGEHMKLTPINIKVDRILTKKNAAIEDLEYELARISKAHEDALQTYQGKLEQYGIPSEELGFAPLRTAMLTSKSPAGLVAVNK